MELLRFLRLEGGGRFLPANERAIDKSTSLVEALLGGMDDGDNDIVSDSLLGTLV